MFALLFKEINSFFSSLIGYIFIIVFLLVNGYLLWGFPYFPNADLFNIISYEYAGIKQFFDLAPIVFVFLIPAITMRSFSEEKRLGTIELLFTKPLSELTIVLAKYFACLILVLFSLLPTFIYFITVYIYGNPTGNIDLGGTWGSYIGLFYLSASFVAIGVFCSSVTKNQIVAFILSFLLCVLLYIGFELAYIGTESMVNSSVFHNIDLFIQQLGINAHYVSMSRGVIDTRDVLYFLSLITVFILLTKVVLERRKW